MSSDRSPWRGWVEFMPGLLMVSSEAGPSWRQCGHVLRSPTTTTTTSVTAAVASTPPGLLTTPTAAGSTSRTSLSPVHSFMSATSPLAIAARGHVTCVSSSSACVVSTKSYVTDLNNQGGATSLSVRSPTCVTPAVHQPSCSRQHLHLSTHR